MKRSKISNILVVIFTTCVACFSIHAQDSLTINQTYYRFSYGGGIGRGYPQQSTGLGISFLGEAAFQKNKNIYAIGTRGVVEFAILGVDFPMLSTHSIDITYGRALLQRRWFTSVSAGIGWVTTTKRGNLISRDPGWFASSYYEKRQSHTIGFPIQANIYWLPATFYGLGLVAYANVNSKETFYSLSFCHQFGKLRPKVKRRQKN